MDTALKNILEKLARDRAVASLSEADYAYLARVVGTGGGDAAADADRPAPLWRFVRRNTLLFKGIFDYHLDAELDALLTDAGAPSESLKGYQHEVRITAMVTRDGLKRAVRRHLTSEQTTTRAHAARLVGLLELTELAPTLVDGLESGREERRDWGMPVIAASLESLAMLGHPQARQLATRYVSHEDWGLRRAAQGAALVAEGVPSPELLRRIFDSQFDWSLIAALPDVFLAAAKNGALVESEVDRILESVPPYVSAVEALADVVIAAEWKDAFKKLLAYPAPDFRSALVVKLAWSKATWAVPLLREHLEEEQMPDPRMCIVAALGTIAGGDESLVRARFASDEAADQLGAIWSSVGTGKYKDDLERLARDTNAQVRRAALAALAVNEKSPDPRHVEVAFTDLLNNEDEWWTWGLPVHALAATGVPSPVCADAFRYVARDFGRFSPQELDRAIAIFTEHPLHLLRWLRADVPSSQRVRALAFAGMIGGATFEDAVEHVLLETDKTDVAHAAALEVLAGRGPTCKAAEVKTRVALHDAPKPVEGALLATVACAFNGESTLRRRATTALATYGNDAEPYLAMLLGSSDAEVARAAAEAVAQLPSLHDPLLADVARLLTGDARTFADTGTLERLVMCLSPRVRRAIAEAGALPDVPKAEVLRVFPFLLVDRDADVSSAALGSLAAQAGDLPWVKQLVLASTWSPDWRVREKAIGALGQIADPSFVRRLLELVDEDDGGSKDNAVKGLERVAEMRPELGIVVLDIREPHRVGTRYGLNEQVNWEAEKHTEGLRLLILGLDKRKSAAEAKKHLGRKVMITPAVGVDGEIHAGQGTWSNDLVDALAMYLRVVYTDEESGAIVAEVGEDPTAEVLSAVLQSTSVAVRRIAWS